MAASYHNLAGLLRDLEAVERQLDANTTALWERWCLVIDSALADVDGLGDDGVDGAASDDGADSTAASSDEQLLEVRQDGAPGARVAPGAHGRTTPPGRTVVRDGSPMGGAQGLTDAQLQAELLRRGLKHGKVRHG